MRFTFKHRTGSRAGQEQVIEGRVVNVGRNPTNLLSFDPEKDDRVSGNHAQLLALDDGRVVLSDLGSRNGTLVNGQKIQGQLPLASGTVVQFGSEGGPEVEVTYGAAPAPAAPPAPVAPKASGGGGKGLLLAGCCGALMLGGCVVAAAAVLMARPATPGPQPVPEGPVAAVTEAAPATEAPKTEAPPPVTEKPAVVDRRTAWGKLGVGSRFESRSVMEMDTGSMKMKSETTTIQTVKEVKGDDVIVTVETKMKSTTTIPNMDPTVSEQNSSTESPYPAKVPETTTETKGEEPKREKDKVTVPAGTFDCWKYTTVTKDAAGAETVTESWMAEDEAVPYKMVMKSPTMTMTTELVTMEKK